MSQLTKVIPHVPVLFSGRRSHLSKFMQKCPTHLQVAAAQAQILETCSPMYIQRDPLSGGVGPQSLIINSTVHLPALSPRRQVVTNGKSRPTVFADKTTGIWKHIFPMHR